jgi:hypothetical protein
MTNPRHYLFMMVVYLAVVAGVCALLYAPLKSAFLANWGFNLLILGALGIGILINMHQVLRLEPEINWMKIFRTGGAGISVAAPPRILYPLTRHLSDIHRDRFRLSALSLRTVLEGIRGHLDEAREISRYMIGLLIFLGLLGTFWGLLGTIADVARVIDHLDVGTRDFALFFDRLKAGLQQPLQGMGTAFSSSLFGLGGSLVLGFLDLQSGHAQNRFFNEMEEWLSGVTQLIDTQQPTAGTPADHVPPAGDLQSTLAVLLDELRQSNAAIRQLLVDRGDLPPVEDRPEPPEG